MPDLFHPDTSRLSSVMIDSILRRWSMPSISFLPDHEDSYDAGFVVHDSFAGTWEIRITKTKER